MFLSISILIFQIANFNDLINDLKLNHVFVIFLLFLLSVINLFIESKIWESLIKGSFTQDSKEIFKSVCLSYNFRILSNEFIGSVIAKSRIFGNQIKSNIYGNLNFGIYQSLGTIFLALSILLFQFKTYNLYIESWLNEEFMNVAYYLTAVVLFLFFIFTQVYIKRSKAFNFSLLRSFIYYSQFSIAILFFYPAENFSILISSVAIYFILKTFVPIFNFMGGLGIRELTLASILSLFTMDASFMIIVSFYVWLANFILPNILGFIIQSRYRKWSLSAF